MPATELAKHLNIKIITPSEIPGIPDDLLELLHKGRDLWSAAIFSRAEKKYIIHNPLHSPARQESNLMHELAHAICEHQLMELETALTSCVIPLRKYDIVQEAEAECLGACLQLPQKALFHYYHILKKNNSEISNIFTASSEMVRYRLSITGVLRIKYPK
ncbi:MAG: ImmA/IrrE family metallo-endopeptidase [Chitinophagales bacterium]|nr:ImmA/IrrE family metallo-endopeptidase [Chitinophagales bacterium]